MWGTFARMRATVATWNAWWAHAGTPRGRRVAEVVVGLGADVVVLTEAEAGVLPPDGFVVDAGADWGYPTGRDGRRKVLMWSAQPWSDIDAFGSADLPGGRWVAATTSTSIGPVRVVGVCIPWSGAHVTTGRRDRRPWQDHSSYLDGLGPLLATQPRPLVVTGDFNQRIPRSRQPRQVADALDSAFRDLLIATAGQTEHGFLIDHVAHSGDLHAERTTVLSKTDALGRLSDHTGATVTLKRSM